MMAHQAPRDCATSVSLAVLLFCAAALTGCGVGPSLTSSSGTLAMQGQVMGGQQPVVNAQVSLWVAGIGGNGTAAGNLMGTGTGSKLAYTTTDSNGRFSLAGDFTCPTTAYTPQVYAVAVGGSPGLATAPNNSSIVLVDALGPCNSLGSQTKIALNEVTTVAAAWALSPFMQDYAYVASSATNTSGLASAFLNAQLLADPASGVSPGSSLPAGNTIESGKLYALADIIATCVNSDGATPCQALYSASGQCSSSCSQNTLTAALYIVQHPAPGAATVATLFGLIPPDQPYTTALTIPPNDWTMSMTIPGGGLNTPTELSIDTAGNVWVADYYGAVSAFSPQGAALSPAAGFAATTVSDVYGLTVDTNNNVWVANEEAPKGNGSITGLYGISSGQTLGSVITTFANSDIYFPESLASNTNGQVIIANYGDSTTTVFTYNASTGQAQYLLANAAYGYTAEPTDVAGDVNGGVWLADEGGRTVTHVDASGNILSHPSCCNAANGIATDTAGNAWVANYYDNSVSEIAPGCDSHASTSAACYGAQTNVITIGATSACGQTGAPAGSCGDQTGGLNSPAKVAVDAGNHIWIVNYHGQSFTELAGISQSVAAGTAISPSNTYNTDGSIATHGGYGLDAALLEPFDIAPDASGNLWVSNEAYNDLVVFFGLATPTATPRLPVPTAP